MSYSFQTKGATQQLLLGEIADQLDKVIKDQPIHTRDREAVLTSCSAMISLLMPAETGFQFTATVSGWVSWTTGGAALNGCNVQITVDRVPC